MPRSPVVLIVRLVILAGVTMYVVGGLTGWFTGSDGFSELRISPHELVGGQWIWLVLLPLLLATVAPFRVRWLAFLWLAPVPALLLVLGAMIFHSGITLPFPYSGWQIEGPHWGLLLSYLGAAFATLALLGALLLVALRLEPASSLGLFRRLAQVNRRVLAGVSLLVVLAVATIILISRDPETGRVEGRLAREVKELALRCRQPYPVNKPVPVPQVRVHCDRIKPRLWQCAFDYDYSNGKDGGSASFTTDGTAFGELGC